MANKKFSEYNLASAGEILSTYLPSFNSSDNYKVKLTEIYAPYMIAGYTYADPRPATREWSVRFDQQTSSRKGGWFRVLFSPHMIQPLYQKSSVFIQGYYDNSPPTLHGDILDGFLGFLPDYEAYSLANIPSYFSIQVGQLWEDLPGDIATYVRDNGSSGQTVYYNCPVSFYPGTNIFYVQDYPSIRSGVQ